MQNPLNNIEIIRFLSQLRESDPDAFIRSVLLILKTFRTEALEDLAETDTKLAAIDTLLAYFEEIEEFEECQFLLDLKEEIGGEAL